MAEVDIDVYKEWLGIPEGPRPPDHYQILRLVQFEDSADKIRNNYKKLNAHVRKYAAGKYSVRSQELLNELAKAMLCLTDSERKREYDSSQGRKFPKEKGLKRQPLEVVLVQKQAISQSQMEEARNHANKTGLDMRDVVVQLKLVDQATATQAYAEELGLSYVELADLLPDDAILDQIPRNVVKQNSILPLFVDEEADMLLIACVHPLEPDLEEQIRLRTNHPVRPVLATPLEINQGIAKYYAPGMRQEVAAPTSSGKKGGAAKAPAKALSQLTPEELRNRQMMGVLGICWTAIPSALFDVYVVPDKFRLLGLCVTFLTVPLVSALVYFKCFKR